MDRDGYISNGELFQVLKMMVGNNLKDNQLQQIVDKTILFHDKDGDGKISMTHLGASMYHFLGCRAYRSSQENGTRKYLIRILPKSCFDKTWIDIYKKDFILVINWIRFDEHMRSGLYNSNPISTGHLILKDARIFKAKNSKKDIYMIMGQVNAPIDDIEQEKCFFRVVMRLFFVLKNATTFQDRTSSGTYKVYIWLENRKDMKKAKKHVMKFLENVRRETSN
ncbi:hypothetical protein X798_05065 [Onchocerca flexuosa]|uniref:EF-hand domain-containing protein n=1 Tax=Onchocerca flexuosa TaxID=387005 RepID=A0A238BTR4_9BILA|nr:hypothetical protein X798_05065 [Onchocerca flexuosa]